MIILYLLLSVLFVSVLVFIFAEAKAHKGNAGGEKDYLLILGCRVRENEAEKTLYMRAEKAAEYLKEHKNTLAIACGGIVHKDQYISEAEAIKDILISKGIEEERIILEDKSTTTVENFLNAKKIIDSCGSFNSERIAFLSSEFHLLRAAFIAKKKAFSCQTVAAPSPKNELLKNYIREYFAFIIFIVGGK